MKKKSEVILARPVKISFAPPADQGAFGGRILRWLKDWSLRDPVIDSAWQQPAIGGGVGARAARVEN